jgi:hypothetical protein
MPSFTADRIDPTSLGSKTCHFKAFTYLVPFTASVRYDWSTHSRVSRSSQQILQSRCIPRSSYL